MDWWLLFFSVKRQHFSKLSALTNNKHSIHSNTQPSKFQESLQEKKRGERQKAASNLISNLFGLNRFILLQSLEFSCHTHTDNGKYHYYSQGRMMKVHQLVGNRTCERFWITNLSFCHLTLLSCKNIAVVSWILTPLSKAGWSLLWATTVFWHVYISKDLSLFFLPWKKNGEHIALLTGFVIVHFWGQFLQIRFYIIILKYSVCKID